MYLVFGIPSALDGQTLLQQRVDESKHVPVGDFEVKRNFYDGSGRLIICCVSSGEKAVQMSEKQLSNKATSIETTRTHSNRTVTREKTLKRRSKETRGRKGERKCTRKQNEAWRSLSSNPAHGHFPTYVRVHLNAAHSMSQDWTKFDSFRFKGETNSGLAPYGREQEEMVVEQRAQSSERRRLSSGPFQLKHALAQSRNFCARRTCRLT